MFWVPVVDFDTESISAFCEESPVLFLRSGAVDCTAEEEKAAGELFANDHLSSARMR